MFKRKSSLTGNIKKDMKRLKRSIENGDASAMVVLALLIKEDNPQEAIRLFEAAADKGEVDGYIGLAILIQEKNPKRAADLYEKAIAQGNVYAMVGLANLLRDQDQQRAVDLFEQAISNGYKTSLVSHATFIQDVNPQKAITLFEQAVAQGDETALYRLNALSGVTAVIGDDDEKAHASALHEETSQTITSSEATIRGMKDIVAYVNSYKNMYCYLLFDTSTDVLFCESFQREIKSAREFDCFDRVEQGVVKLIGRVSPEDHEFGAIDKKFIREIVVINKLKGNI